MLYFRYIYWSDWREPRIDYARLDGSNYRVFLNESVGLRVKGLTIDYDANGERYLYWCDTLAKNIMRANMVTRHTEALLRDVGDCAGVTVHGDYVYWTHS